MLTALAVLGGFGLDLLLADPAWMPHPVVGMGRAIAALEKRLRRLFPATPAGERAAGRVLAAALPLGTFALAAGALALAYRLHPAAGFALETLWCWQALALRGLADESGKVYAQLAKGDLPAARRAVSRIVGRDTGSLTAAGVTKAAVETVAENFSDGVAAPLFYLLIGGAPLGLAYKAVNTMDSMVGYKNKTYLQRPAWTTRPTFSRPGWRRCSGSGRRAWPASTGGGPGASGGGTACATPAPTRPRPNRPAPGPWASSWPAPPGILENTTTSPPSGTTPGRWSPRTSCERTGCCTWRVFWLWGWGWGCALAWRPF